MSVKRRRPATPPPRQPRPATPPACRHLHEQTLYAQGPWYVHMWMPADNGTVEHQGVDAWCRDCGALAYWNAAGTRRIWKKPKNRTA